MRALGWAFFLLLTVACRPPSANAVWLARGVAFSLRAPATGPRFFASQEVICQLPSGEPATLLTAVENDGHNLNIVASSTLGLTLFTLRCQDGATVVDARVPLPARLDPLLLPAMVQLANWPLAEAQKGLGSGCELSEDGPLRTLRHHGQTVLTLAREGLEPPFTCIRLIAPGAGISLEIRTLELIP